MLITSLVVLLLIKWFWKKHQKKVEGNNIKGIVNSSVTLMGPAFPTHDNVLDVNEQRQVWTASYLAGKKDLIV